MKMNILSFIYRTTSAFISNHLLPLVNTREKKIYAIALVALSFLAACYTAYCCHFKAKQIEPLKKTATLPIVSDKLNKITVKGS